MNFFKSLGPKSEQDPKLKQFFILRCAVIFEIFCRVAYNVKLKDSLEKLPMSRYENWVKKGQSWENMYHQ